MSLLPPNASPLERGLEAAIAPATVLPVPLRTLWDPDTCPEGLLPYLAWAVSIDQWNPDWPVTIRRAQVRAAIAVQRMKGTVAAIRTTVRSFGGDIVLREWWQTSPPGPPHTFTLVLSLQGVGGETATAAYVDEVIGAVRRTKPARSHFTFTQAIASAGAIGLVAAARPAIHARLSLTA